MKNFFLITCLSLIVFQQGFAQSKPSGFDTSKQKLLVITSFKDSSGYNRTYFQGLTVMSKKSGKKLLQLEHKIEDLIVVSKDTIYVDSTKKRIIEYHIQFLLPDDIRLEDVDLIPQMEYHKPGGAQSLVGYNCAAIETSSHRISFKSNRADCCFLALDAPTHLKGNGYYENLLTNFVKLDVAPPTNSFNKLPLHISQCNTILIIGERRMVVLYTVKDGPLLSTDFKTFGEVIPEVVPLNFN